MEGCEAGIIPSTWDITGELLHEPRLKTSKQTSEEDSIVINFSGKNGEQG